LSGDQALVLSDWLHRVMCTAAFDGLVNADPAVWSSLYRLAGTLETSLTEVFTADYVVRLDQARERLSVEVGEVAPPVD
jgi:hypothetical protein